MPISSLPPGLEDIWLIWGSGATDVYIGASLMGHPTLVHGKPGQ
jgi:hypothetical protein